MGPEVSRMERPSIATLAGRRAIAVITFTFGVFICALARGDLNADLRAVLQDKALSRGETGVEIARLERDGKPDILFRHNSDIPLIPASNLKLITTSAFLDHFGSDFRYRTILAQRGDD